MGWIWKPWVLAEAKWETSLTSKPPIQTTNESEADPVFMIFWRIAFEQPLVRAVASLVLV